MNDKDSTGRERPPTHGVFRIAAGFVTGYVVMVLLITLVQEVIFGGVSYHESSNSELLGAGLLTVGCAVVGGWTAAAIAGHRPWLVALIMSLLVAAETTALVITGKVGGPLWFDVLAALSLMLGLFAGAWLSTLEPKSD